MAPKARSATIRFWSMVNKDGPIHPICGQCWIWLGKGRSGVYGHLTVDGKNRRAHKYSYEIHYGEVPDGMQVLHSCDTPLCVNPAHLRAGTQKENQEEMVRKGRANRGEDRPQSILTEDKVREIRKLHSQGISAKKLGPRFGVSGVTILNVVKRKAWSHVI